MNMDFKTGTPEESGEYLVVLETEQGPQLEIMNYGVTDQYPVKNWYLVGTKGPIYFENVIKWATIPDLKVL